MKRGDQVTQKADQAWRGIPATSSEEGGTERRPHVVAAPGRTGLEEPAGGRGPFRIVTEG